jgi:hypothetical protein
MFKADGDKNESRKKAAKSFAKKMYQKFGATDHSLDNILSKAHAEAKSHGVDDDTFNYFLEYYVAIRNKDKGGLVEPEFETSKIAKQIGSVFPSFSGYKGKFVINGEKDEKAFKAIASMAETSKNSQALASYQCMTYYRPDTIIQSQFKIGRDDPSAHVHPVLAALFTPKIPFLERRMLMSNLAGMITGLKNHQGPRTTADYEFFVDLTRDPNTSICSGQSVLEDLKSRCEVQMMLRNIVHRFRNGFVYNSDFAGFMQLMAKCQMDPNDHPHLLFMRDEGVLMSRLLNIFSLRPVKVTTNTPVTAMTPQLPFPFRPIQDRGFVEVRLPYPSPGGVVAGPPVDLLASLGTPMWQLNGRAMVPQSQNIWFCQDLLIFYVNRRYPSLQWQQAAYTYTRLPTLVTGQDRCNTYPVKVDKVLPNIGGCQYNLQSVVVCNTDSLEADGVTTSDAITGSSTLFCRWPLPNDVNPNANAPSFHWYDPLNALNVMDQYGNPVPVNDRRPVTPLFENRQNIGGVEYEGFDDLASRYGTIFVYSKAQ